jgi:hypothetical protein
VRPVPNELLTESRLCDSVSKASGPGIQETLLPRRRGGKCQRDLPRCRAYQRSEPRRPPTLCSASTPAMYKWCRVRPAPLVCAAQGGDGRIGVFQAKTRAGACSSARIEDQNEVLHALRMDALSFHFLNRISFASNVGNGNAITRTVVDVSSTPGSEGVARRELALGESAYVVCQIELIQSHHRSSF